MIRIRILGSAAGGGLPQWNCACPNCGAARAGKIPPRTQSSIAISGDGREWLLVNASPDLPAQIEAFPPLQPRAIAPRNSPIVGVCLTNPDIDHALGLILLRQRDEPLVVYGTDETRQALHWINIALEPFPGIEWRTFGRGKLDRFKRSSLRVIGLPKSVALEFEEENSARRILIAPAVADLTDELQDAIQRADAILFEGTFWSDDELKPLRASARTSREMGHIPVEESLAALRSAPAAHKIYVHINNTNPILQPESPQAKEVERAGIIVGYDGLELHL